MDKTTNLQPWSIATVLSMTGLALLAVGLRLLSRYERKQSLWWDDWMILFSMGWNLIVIGFIFAMINRGMGLHAEDVPIPQIVQMAKYLLVAEILYVYNLVWTKLSFLMMYYRIFRFPYFKRWAIGIGTFVVLWVICITFMFIFICVPVEKLWYPDLPGHCIDQVSTWIANATSTIATDLAILILPIPQIWRLHLGRPEKIALTFAFGLGFFVVFASAYRFTILFSYSVDDPTYTLAPTVGWTAIEMSAGIVSACLPTIQPAIHFIARNLGLMTKSHRSTTAGTSATSQTLGTGKLPHSQDARTEFDAKRMSTGNGTGAFYRLPDRSGSAGTDGAGNVQSGQKDIKLRPDHGCVYEVSSVPNEEGDRHVNMGDRDGDGSIGEGGAGGGVPLNRIGVTRDFRQTRADAFA